MNSHIVCVVLVVVISLHACLAQFPGMGSGTGSPSGNPLLGNPLMAYMAFSGLDLNKMLYASMLSGQLGGAGGLGAGLGGMGLFAPAFLFNAIN